MYTNIQQIHLITITVSGLVTTPASMADLFMAFSTSNSGASMNTTYGRNSDVLRTFKA